MIPENEQSTVTDILNSSDRKQAKRVKDFGKMIALTFDAVTSTMFGYEFVRLIPTKATVLGGVSMSGIVGGLACLGLTAGMARIWNTTQLKAAESEQQHNIASAAYYGSVVVSLTMTVIYLVIAIFGLQADLGGDWLIFGRIVVTVVAMGQLAAWLFYERYSPQYQRELIRTITGARMAAAVLDIEAKAIDTARAKANAMLTPYISPLADQMASQASKAALARLQYSTGDLPQLPALPTSAEVAPLPQRATIRPNDHITIYPLQNGQGVNGRGNGSNGSNDFLARQGGD